MAVTESERTRLKRCADICTDNLTGYVAVSVSVTHYRGYRSDWSIDDMLHFCLVVMANHETRQ